ncbi:MAG: hypothetical protein PWQ63_1241 [Methanolobus sp.]|nr:hypothetical protein [Methanolobus sp.]MDK2948081.1 hypothetical protein [Methanolobus sp.]
MKQNTNLKTIAGIFVFLAVFLLAIFFLAIDHPEAGIDNSRSGLYVIVKPARGEPVNFVEFTQEDLEKYPYVQKAFFSPNGKSKVPFEDEEVMENLDKFYLILYNNSTEYMKVGENYYQCSLEWADYHLEK